MWTCLRQALKTFTFSPVDFFLFHVLGVKKTAVLILQLLLGTTVSGLDLAKKELTTSTGDTLTYEKLLIATGSTAVK
jgi:NADPH-dependent 2,4-dienoyl-CoA reductase/sulfur reductase-like enzyme